MALTYRISTSEYGLMVLQVVLENNPTIEIELGEFYKDQNNILTLYEQINEYVAMLHTSTQQQIYDSFYRVHLSNKNNYSDHMHVNMLENELINVCILLNYDNFKQWMVSKSDGIIMPETILDVHVFDQDLSVTEEKTYVRSEYRDLISMIIFMRALVPVYLNYYTYIKQVTSHYYYKLFTLFMQSSIYDSPEIDKLKRYIEANQLTLIGAVKNEHLVINAGLSDDDVLDSLLSEVIFNKLLTIDFFRKKCNIISFIFQTIKYKGSFITADSILIRSKSIANDPNKEDISYFEDYRKTSSIPIGTVTEIQHALSNIEPLILTLGYTNFDYEAYKNELSNMSGLLDNKIDKVQIYILGWFMSKIINPRALYYIEYRQLIELLLFAKVVLMQNGQTFMGLLLGSHKSLENNYVNVMIKNSVSKSLIQSLSKYYSGVLEEGKQSIVEKTISEVAKEITNYLWIPVGAHKKQNELINQDGFLIVPNNINDIVCEYVAFVNS